MHNLGEFKTRLCDDRDGTMVYYGNVADASVSGLRARALDQILFVLVNRETNSFVCQFWNSDDKTGMLRHQLLPLVWRMQTIINRWCAIRQQQTDAVELSLL